MLPDMASSEAWENARHHAPYATPYGRAGPAYGTPPLSSGPAAEARPSGGGSTSPIALMRAVGSLSRGLDEDAVCSGVLIACNPTHAKYPLLRRIIEAFKDDEEGMARFVGALVGDNAA